MIKFRAWHKELKMMCEVNSMNFNDKGLCSLYLKVPEIPHPYHAQVRAEDIELMQWTGQNDKNNTPIFNGDIVDGGWEDGIGRMRVQWDKDKCMFCFMWIGEPWDWHEFDEFTENDLLVIGNIYCNPELLEQS